MTINDHDALLPRKRVLGAVVGICLVILLAVLSSFLFETRLDGPGDPAVRRLDTGWSCVRNGAVQLIESLPCTLDVSEGEPLVLRRRLTEEEKLHSRYVLTLRSRYASVRIWADGALVYEAAQGKEHAMGSMWHFLPMARCADAEWLTVELCPYGSSAYTVESILLDTPGAVRHALLTDNSAAILFGAVCLLFAVAMLLATILLAVWKSRTYAPVLAFMLFLLLSGSWIFLDSKITTLGGGNYALSYFLSYAAFYLLTAPMLAYIRLMTKDCGRILSALIWAVILNAGICFVLHMTGLVQLRDTAVSVHVLIVASLPVSTVALWRSVVRLREKHLRWTFIGLMSVYAFGLISIVLYYLKRLPAANSAQLYMIGLTILITGMAVDMASSFSYFWKTQAQADHYRRLAIVDSMTELGNRNAFQIKLAALPEQQPEKVAFVFFDVDNLKLINDQQGHHVGDQAIYLAAQCIRTAFGHAGDCYRIGGDEFAAVIAGRPVSRVPEILERFQREVEHRWDWSLPSCGISYGWASAEFSEETPVTEESLTGLQADADRSLYQNKQARKAGEAAPSVSL